MNLSEPFINRPVMTVLATISVLALGVYAYTRLPVNDLPAVDYPVITVNVAYPGADPDTMANNVATPLERQFMQIPGLELVTSKSGQGNTSFVLQFALEKSLDGAATDVQAAITQAQGNLPADLPSPPTMSKTNPNDQPIMFLALTTNTVTQGALYDFANTQVGQEISIISGVARVQIFGTKGAVRIKADPSKLAARGMTVEDLAKAIQGGTSYTGAGQFDNPNVTMLVKPKGQLDTAEGYNNLIVAKNGNSPVYLRDVAQANDGVQDERINMRFWSREYGTPASTVVVAVYRQAGGNAVAVTKAIRDKLPKIRAELPPSVILAPIYDRSLTIVNSVNDVQETLLIAFVLVVIVIFLFLGRAGDTLIPAMALPMSLLLTFGVMWALGYSLDNLSLMALTLAIGFLVDDAIVFLENTVRRMETYNEPILAATINSAKEISFTIVSMTLSLAAVFLPLVLMSGLMGRIFREFSVTIIVAIFASGLVSLTLTPMMCSRLVGDRRKGAKKPWLERLAQKVEHAVLAVYGRTLTWALRHHYLSAIAWIACLIGTIGLFRAIPKTFLPVGDGGFIWGFMIGQDKASYLKMREYQDKGDAVMQANPGVAATFTMTGNGQFLTYNQGLLLAFLEPRDKRAPIADIAKSMINKVPGVITVFRPQPVLQISTGASANSAADLIYTISGVDPKDVYAASGRLLPKLQEFKGFQHIQPDYYNNQPNLDVHIRRDQVSMYGVSVARIESLLFNSFSENYLYLIKKPTDQYQVILTANDQSRQTPQDLSKLYIKSDDGLRTIPLSAVTEWGTSLGMQSVNHLNQFTSVTFAFNLVPGTATGDATNFIEKAAAETLPTTVRGDLQGEAKTFKDTVTDLSLLMIVAVFVMYVILGILYESYLHPITVLSSLPVALVGGLATLWIFHEQASLYAYVGMFLLMGIVKKNGIMIVDFALQRVNHGETAEKAIHDASMDRFRPIIMTTLAAVMGALPIALGYGADGESRRSLGLVIVGGLLVSQFITLYVTPVIYLYLEVIQEKVLDRTTFFRSHRVHAAALAAELGTPPEAEVLEPQYVEPLHGASRIKSNGNGDEQN